MYYGPEHISHKLQEWACEMGIRIEYIQPGNPQQNAYVEKHGKFSFCNCTHTLEDIADPMVALKYMPMIAEQGFIAVPSKYYELQRRESFRGAIHHRWIWNGRNNRLVGYPKINLIEYISYGEYDKIIAEQSETELRVFWQDDIDYEIINNDYLGPTREAVIDMYVDLIY